MLKIGTSPAIAQQSDMTRACSPRPTTPYKVPHSRTPIVSRAKGNSSGLRTYSCVPLHLRGNALDRNETKTQTNVSSSNNTADSDKGKSDNTRKQISVRRKIHTPARSVQMVHAVVAPNDIYGKTNSPYQNNRNL